jgi:hypothetical protein
MGTLIDGVTNNEYEGKVHDEKIVECLLLLFMV